MAYHHQHGQNIHHVNYTPSLERMLHNLLATSHQNSESLRLLLHNQGVDRARLDSIDYHIGKLRDSSKSVQESVESVDATTKSQYMKMSSHLGRGAEIQVKSAQHVLSTLKRFEEGQEKKLNSIDYAVQEMLERMRDPDAPGETYPRRTSRFSR